jgi:hypothetical protein
MTREEFERAVELELPSLDHDARASLARWRVSPQQVHRILRHGSGERDSVWVLARAGAQVLFWDDTGNEWGTAMLDMDGIMREWGSWGDRLGRALRQFPGR